MSLKRRRRSSKSTGTETQPASSVRGSSHPESNQPPVSEAAPSLAITHAGDSGEPEVWLARLSRGRRIGLWLIILWFGVICAGSFFSTRFQPSRNLWWFIAFPLGCIGPAFMLARRRALDQALRLLPHPDEEITALVRAYLDRHEHGRDPLIVGWLTALAFGAFRFSASWDVREILYSVPFLLHSAILVYGIGCLAQTIWLMLYFGRLINALTLRVADPASRLFTWSPVSAMGNGYARTSLGAALLSLAFLGLILTNFRLFASDLQSHYYQIVLMEAVFGLAVITPLLYLLLPQWHLRTLLCERKAALLHQHQPLMLEAERFCLDHPLDQAGIERFLLRRREHSEIEALPSWPFDLNAVAPMVSVFAIPALLFILKEVLVDVIVAWAKG